MAIIFYKVECPSCGILCEGQTYSEARDAESLHRNQTGHDPTIITEEPL